jgi:hypothetical protein
MRFAYTVDDMFRVIYGRVHVPNNIPGELNRYGRQIKKKKTAKPNKNRTGGRIMFGRKLFRKHNTQYVIHTVSRVFRVHAVCKQNRNVICCLRFSI